jgi:hypothetical protein
MDYADSLIENEAREQYGPEDKCRCGHVFDEHEDNFGCKHWSHANEGFCACLNFRPVEPSDEE